VVKGSNEPNRCVRKINGELNEMQQFLDRFAGWVLANPDYKYPADPKFGRGCQPMVCLHLQNHHIYELLEDI
jgi:hypothetical protein